jgi:predicted O-linked N-acetylglucosamine transferase (SPINDLY family)
VTPGNASFQTALDLFRQGRYSETCTLCRRLLRIGPANSEVWQLAAFANVRLGQCARAVRQLNRAISLSPKEARFRASLASLHLSMGRVRGALRCGEYARRLAPDDLQIVSILARVCLTAGEHRRTIELLERWRSGDSGSVREPLAQAYALDGRRLAAAHRYMESARAYENAVELGDTRPAVLSNLGIGYGLCGEHARSLECFRKAIDADQAFLPARSNLLLALQYSASPTPENIAEEHRRHGRAWEAGALVPPPRSDRIHPAKRVLRRVLRVGYVSGDFRRHPVACFIEPILLQHDRTKFEVFCYYNAPFADTVTRRLQRAASHWRSIARMDDLEAARLIRADRCDILIDLGGHTHGNRLGVFALRPAAVQATYLGYPGTTGLTSIQYRITDATCDPDGVTDRYHTEKLVRLDGCFVCYRPNSRSPRPEGLPADVTGHFTFGSFNHHPKLSPETTALWAQILRQTPGARLLLKSRSLSDAGVAAATRRLFGMHGVASERLELRGYAVSERQHLATYNEVDLALDPLPYNGTTTTCEALWMGTPVISLEGSAHVSRVGMSLLKAAGLAELIAANEAAYLQMAVTLANDRDGIRRIRTGLRGKMARSALCDAAGFTRRFEAALWQMWEA